MSKKGYIIWGTIFAVAAIVILAGIYQVYHSTDVKNNKIKKERDEKEKVISFHVDEDKTADMTFSMTHSDTWHDGARPSLVFAQYDGVIKNNTNRDFTDWIITLKFTRPSEINQIWNADYKKIDDYTYELVAVDYDPIIFGNGGELPFGYVLNSTELQNLDSIDIKGHYIAYVGKLYDWRKDHRYFKLKILAELWVVSFLIFILVCLRMSAEKRSKQREEAILIHSIDTLVDFIEAKDEYTKGHSKRVASYTRKIAKRMQLPKDKVQNYYFAALMHDCGKIGIPDDILKKNASLTDEEYEVIKHHTSVGAGMLSNFKDIKDIEFGALHHHERYDGTGYPAGLKELEISEVGRIICVADAFDGMNRDRCYRKHITKEEIISELKKNKGSQFDPDIVDLFLEMLEDGTVTFDSL